MESITSSLNKINYNQILLRKQEILKFFSNQMNQSELSSFQEEGNLNELYSLIKNKDLKHVIELLRNTNNKDYNKYIYKLDIIRFILNFLKDILNMDQSGNIIEKLLEENKNNPFKNANDLMNNQIFDFLNSLDKENLNVLYTFCIEKNFKEINRFLINSQNFSLGNDLNTILTCIYPKRILYIMRGVPGMGKSTFIKKILERELNLNDYDTCSQYIKKMHVLSQDDFNTKDNDMYIFNPDKLLNNHQLNQKRTEISMRLNLKPLIIDNTNITVKEIIPYVQLAIENNYIPIIINPEEYNSNENPIILDNGSVNRDLILKRNKEREIINKVIPENILNPKINQLEKNPIITIEDVINK